MLPTQLHPTTTYTSQQQFNAVLNFVKEAGVKTLSCGESTIVDSENIDLTLIKENVPKNKEVTVGVGGTQFQLPSSVTDEFSSDGCLAQSLVTIREYPFECGQVSERVEEGGRLRFDEKRGRHVCFCFCPSYLIIVVVVVAVLVVAAVALLLLLLLLLFRLLLLLVVSFAAVISNQLIQWTNLSSMFLLACF